MFYSFLVESGQRLDKFVMSLCRYSKDAKLAENQAFASIATERQQRHSKNKMAQLAHLALF